MKCGTRDDENQEKSLESQVEHLIGSTNMIYFNYIRQVSIFSITI